MLSKKNTTARVCAAERFCSVESWNRRGSGGGGGQDCGWGRVGSVLRGCSRLGVAEGSIPALSGRISCHMLPLRIA